MEREIEEDVFHSVIPKSLKKLKEIFEDAAKETSYKFDEIDELLVKYVTEELMEAEYRSIIQSVISKLKVFQSQYSGEHAHLGFEAEIVVRAIENLRRLINELIVIMGSEDRELPLTRLAWDKMITSEEKEKFEHELSPEIIKHVLRKRPVVTYSILQETGPDLKVIWE